VTHPVLWEGTQRYGSDAYAPDAVVAGYNRPIEAAAQFASFPAGPSTRLHDARRFAVAQAEQLGLSARRTADLELIVTELVANSLRHTPGTCELQIWRDGDQLVCAVRDEGRLTDPLAGRRPAELGQLNGRGLLLVNQLADLVRLHTTDHGTTVYAFLRLDHS
jgi:anti-sigma regulatory factor (Ser/Thr protein kinase)